MGLDLVELLMSIEEEFGVHVDDAIAYRLETPGAVADYLCARLRTSKTEPCPSQVGFYRLRNAIVRTFGIERKMITPNYPLVPIMADDVKANWLLLQNAVGSTEFPRLKRKPILYISTVLMIPGVVTALVLTTPLPAIWSAAVFLLLSTIANRSTYRMGSMIPQEASTVAQLVPYVTSSKSVVWERSKVLERVIELTSVQLDIPKEKISEHSHFIKDLGAD